MFGKLWRWMVNRVFQVTRYKVGYALGYSPDNREEMTLVIYVEAVALGGMPFQVCLAPDAIEAMAEWLKDKDRLVKELKAEDKYAA